MDFVGKVAIVTGAGSGIGAAIAIKLCKQGAKVTIIDKDEYNLKSVSDKCEQIGSKPLIVAGDLTEDDTVKKSVKDTVKHFGKLDILINSAGIGYMVNITDGNALEMFDKVMAINLRAIVNLTSIAAPYLIESKGNILNISSNVSMRPFGPTGFAYNTSKAALDHFSKTIAVELGGKGVRVNVINPGPTRTNLPNNSGHKDEIVVNIWEMLKETTIFKRISEPDEIADLVLFLANDKAKSITGASFVIDNGASAII